MPAITTALRQALLLNGDDGRSEPFGLVARIFILGCLPHSEPHDNEFHRSFGDERFRLSLLAPREVGLPYGRIPRLILSHLTTQAVRERTPDLVLSRSFRGFCALLGLPATGGPNGYLAQVNKQLQRIVNLTVKATWDNTERRLEPGEERVYAGHGYQLASAHFLPWTGKSPGNGPLYLRLSEEFFRLISHKPVPVDLKTLRQLQSPLAMDIYAYCTWRAIRALRQGRPEAVPWRELQKQFGSDYGRLRDFRSRFKAHLGTVLHYYPAIRVEATAESLVIHPYKPHIGSRLR